MNIHRRAGLPPDGHRKPARLALGTAILLMSLPASTVYAASLAVESIQGMPGEQVTFAVLLSTQGAQVAGTQSDIGFDPINAPVASNANGRPDCTVNDAIEKEATSFSFQPPGCQGSACTSVRVLVLSVGNVLPIADGSVLFRCTVNLSPSATPGEYPLSLGGILVSSPDGGRIENPNGSSGAILVGPAAATIHVGADASASAFTVTLDSSEPVAATQNDIFFFGASAAIAATADGRPDCVVNPAIDKANTTFIFLPLGCGPGVDCQQIRAMVISAANVTPIADGSLLYTCRMTHAAMFGTYSLLCSAAVASSPDGTSLPVACNHGSVTLSAPTVTPTVSPTPLPSATPSPTPIGCVGDCDGDGTVTVEELVIGVSMVLTAAPLDACPPFDSDRDESVTVDEVQKGVNNSLGGCPTD